MTWFKHGPISLEKTLMMTSLSHTNTHTHTHKEEEEEEEEEEWKLFIVFIHDNF